MREEILKKRLNSNYGISTDDLYPYDLVQQIEFKKQQLQYLENELDLRNLYLVENWKGHFSLSSKILYNRSTSRGNFIHNTNGVVLLYESNKINIEYFDSNPEIKHKIKTEIPDLVLKTPKDCEEFQKIYEDFTQNPAISLRTAQQKGIISKNINLEKFGIPFSYVARCKNVKYTKQQEDNLTVNFYKESDIKYILEEMGLYEN